MITISSQDTYVFGDAALRVYAIALSGHEPHDNAEACSDVSVEVAPSVLSDWLVLDAERRAEFARLRTQWIAERGATSSIAKMATCPSYQRIIAMGDEVVPLILRQLEQEGDEPDQWFWALAAITGENPVAADAQGDIVQMARAWLDWGRSEDAW